MPAGDIEVPVVAIAPQTHDDGTLDLFLVNRATNGETEATLDVAAFGALQVNEALVLSHDNPFAVNSAEHPDTVVPRARCRTARRWHAVYTPAGRQLGYRAAHTHHPAIMK